jgi:hypothetical protein
MVTTVGVVTGLVAMETLALVWPAGTVTVGGGVAALPLLAMATTAPPVGAGPLRVMLPVAGVPEVVLVCAMVNEVTETPVGGGVGVGDVPQTPGPPPPQTWPKLQPQTMVPPHPSGPMQAGMARSRQVLGEQPLVTVNGRLTGTWPDPLEAAVMLTVWVAATVFEANTVSAPPPTVQPPSTRGWPPVKMDATAGSLLVASTSWPWGGAMRSRVAFMNEIPPAAMVDGVSVKSMT